MNDINYDGPITFESFSSTVVEPKLSNTLGVWRNLWNDSDDLASKAKKESIFKEQRFSDHAPLIIDYDYKL